MTATRETQKQGFRFERWTKEGKTTVRLSGFVLFLLFLAPLLLPATAVDKLTTLWVYMLLAVVWNLLAGYAGLVSVGQQGFFGLSAYLVLRLVDSGMSPWLALMIGAVGAGLAAWPLSYFVLRLKDGEFAIATWVLAEVIRILIMFDPLVQGDTGNSLNALNAYDPEFRRNMIYWLGLASVAGFLIVSFQVLRSKTGSAAQAIRDDEEAARSVGIDIMKTKRIIYVLAAFGSALAGVIWLSSAITFLPRTNFGVQWSVFMLFTVLVGGLRTFEGPILGAIVFFVLQEVFGAFGTWYLFGLGAVAIVFALAMPDGIWGTLRKHFGADLLPTGTRLTIQPDRTSLP